MIRLTSTLLLLLLLSPLQTVAASSVWQVKKGDDLVVLGGTVHLLPAAEFPLPAEFETAFAQSTVLYLEAPMPDSNDVQAMQVMMQQLQYPAGSGLKQKLSAAVYQQLSDYLKKFGTDAATLDKFKPGFVAVQLSLLEMSTTGISGEGVDAYFANKAKQQNKPVQFLETLDFQIQLIATMGEGYESDFIRQNLENTAELGPLMLKSIKAWRSGDLAQIDELLLKDARADDPKLFQQMFTERNQHWLRQIQQMFGNQHKELVLVGAGHLPGNDGLLQLLRQAGYEVTQL